MSRGFWLFCLHVAGDQVAEDFAHLFSGLGFEVGDHIFGEPDGGLAHLFAVEGGASGGGFNGARYLVKDLKVTALPGSPQTRAFLPVKPPAPAAKK